MTAITIVRSALKSQLIRNLIGERTIDLFSELSQSQELAQGEDGNSFIPEWLSSLVNRLAGFIFRIVQRAVSWLLKSLWDVILEASFTLAYFDWNQTDASIQAQINQNNVQIAAQLGQLLGTGAVWLASIGVAALASIKFPVIAGRVAIALAEEGGEEIRGQLSGLLSVTRTSVVSSLILGGLLSLRRLRLLGLAPITNQREPWSIAGAIEERVEEIGNDALRAFVENFLEASTDALIEVGYVVSYSIDDFYAAMRLARNNELGPKRTVVLQPDVQVEAEKIVLSGPQTLIQQDVQAAIAQHRMIYNRDLGQIVGQPAEDWLRGTFQRRKLVIVFKSREKPPWRPPPGEPRIRQTQYTIPDIKQGLTWQEIKLAAKQWLWGRYRATANLEAGRQMAVWGATAQEAEDKLRELKSLTSLEIITLSVSEEKDRHPGLRKNSTMMYPAHATLLIRRSTAEITGTNDLSGNNYREDHIRIDLWPDTEPEGLPPLG